MKNCNQSEESSTSASMRSMAASSKEPELVSLEAAICISVVFRKGTVSWISEWMSGPAIGCGASSVWVVKTGSSSAYFPVDEQQIPILLTVV